MATTREWLVYKLVLKAGNVVKDLYGKEIPFHMKADKTVVSKADEESTKVIIPTYIQCFPNDTVIGEESKRKEGTNNIHLFVDPLDGSRMFLMGLHMFSIGAALMRNDVVDFGVLYFPMYDQILWAKRGRGAFCNGKRIIIPDGASLKGGVYLADSFIRKSLEDCLRDIKFFTEAGCSIRIIGCFHFMIALIALGKVVLATSREIKDWDVAPTLPILEEAGGKLTDKYGNPWRPGVKEVIATNGLIHSEALKLFQRIEKGV